MHQSKTSATYMIVFGITGDLANRMLLPALYRLYMANKLPDHFKIIGITRRGTTSDEIKNKLVHQTTITDHTDALDAFIKLIDIVKMDLDAPKDYEWLKRYLESEDERAGACANRLFYLSVPSSSFGPITKQIAMSGLSGSCNHGATASRLLIEKPFGTDLQSAKQLLADLKSGFDESNVYKIDHFLAKKAIYMTMALRHRFPELQKIWNSKHIKRIEINAYEQLDIQGRVAFYEQTGALRDMVQSHLLQVTGMVLSGDFSDETDAGSIHEKKLSALRSLPSAGVESIRKLQYDGYRNEVGNPNTSTETFVELLLRPNGERWSGSTITVRSGKALNIKESSVTMYNEAGGVLVKIDATTDNNSKMYFIDEAIVPASELRHFVSSKNFNDALDSYEKVFNDAIKGDQSLFVSSNEVIEAWRIVEPVLDSALESSDNYVKGDHPDNVATF